MKDKVNDYEIESGTYSTYWSSSKASIGDYASKMLKKIYQGKENLKKIKLLIHHPSVEAQETFEKVWNPKATVGNLLELASEHSIEHFIVMSSIASAFGSAGSIFP